MPEWKKQLLANFQTKAVGQLLDRHHEQAWTQLVIINFRTIFVPSVHHCCLICSLQPRHPFIETLIIPTTSPAIRWLVKTTFSSSFVHPMTLNQWIRSMTTARSPSFISNLARHPSAAKIAGLSPHIITATVNQKKSCWRCLQRAKDQPPSTAAFTLNPREIKPRYTDTPRNTYQKILPLAFETPQKPTLKPRPRRAVFTVMDHEQGASTSIPPSPPSFPKLCLFGSTDMKSWGFVPYNRQI